MVCPRLRQFCGTTSPGCVPKVPPRSCSSKITRAATSRNRTSVRGWDGTTCPCVWAPTSAIRSATGYDEHANPSLRYLVSACQDFNLLAPQILTITCSSPTQDDERGMRCSQDNVGYPLVVLDAYLSQGRTADSGTRRSDECAHRAGARL